MKYCIRCKLGINTEEERYVKVSDFQGKEKIKDVYFHKACWHEWATGKEKQSKALGKATKIMNFAAGKLGYKDEEKEEYILDGRS